MIQDQRPPEEVADFLEHFGVKGMKWGVRKKEPSAPPTLNVKAKGVTVRADGSITIEKGASLQRLIRSDGKSAPLQNMTYASMLEHDNTRYIKTIGGKGMFGGGRDQILGLQATKRITAPSKDEATRMLSDMMINDAEFRKRNTLMFGGPISNKELQQIKDDPGGRTAQAWYHMTNMKLAIDAKMDPDIPFVQSAIRDRLAAKGHNALRDENDVSGLKMKSPIVIFSPEKSLKVTSLSDITDELRRTNKETVAAYKDQGKEWLERELYGNS